MPEPAEPGEVKVLLERIQNGDRGAVSDLASLAPIPNCAGLAAACLRPLFPAILGFPQIW